MLPYKKIDRAEIFEHLPITKQHSLWEFFIDIDDKFQSLKHFDASDKSQKIQRLDYCYISGRLLTEALEKMGWDHVNALEKYYTYTNGRRFKPPKTAISFINAPFDDDYNSYVTREKLIEARTWCHPIDRSPSHETYEIPETGGPETGGFIDSPLPQNLRTEGNFLVSREKIPYRPSLGMSQDQERTDWELTVGLGASKLFKNKEDDYSFLFKDALTSAVMHNDRSIEDEHCKGNVLIPWHISLYLYQRDFFVIDIDCKFIPEGLIKYHNMNLMFACPDIQAIFTHFPDTYQELSVSRRGLHIIGKGKMPISKTRASRRLFCGGTIEFYDFDDRRHIVLTQDVLTSSLGSDTNIPQASEKALNWLASTFFEEDRPTHKVNKFVPSPGFSKSELKENLPDKLKLEEEVSQKELDRKEFDQKVFNLKELDQEEFEFHTQSLPKFVDPISKKESLAIFEDLSSDLRILVKNSYLAQDYNSLINKITKNQYVYEKYLKFFSDESYRISPSEEDFCKAFFVLRVLHPKDVNHKPKFMFFLLQEAINANSQRLDKLYRKDYLERTYVSARMKIDDGQEGAYYAKIMSLTSSKNSKKNSKKEKKEKLRGWLNLKMCSLLTIFRLNSLSVPNHIITLKNTKNEIKAELTATMKSSLDINDLAVLLAVLWQSNLAGASSKMSEEILKQKTKVILDYKRIAFFINAKDSGQARKRVKKSLKKLKDTRLKYNKTYKLDAYDDTENGTCVNTSDNNLLYFDENLMKKPNCVIELNNIFVDMATSANQGYGSLHFTTYHQLVINANKKVAWLYFHLALTIKPLVQNKVISVNELFEQNYILSEVLNQNTKRSRKQTLRILIRQLFDKRELIKDMKLALNTNKKGLVLGLVVTRHIVNLRSQLGSEKQFKEEYDI